ncbi:MAG: aminodeoxychorismate synthase component I [Acidobacteria bacterium]|nr:aminodeoxychorismate synthase component I [Acidobacteriota bacterium]
MSRVIFGSVRTPVSGWRLAFDRASQTRTAKRIDDVLSLLQFADLQARAGAYVVVMLSYEAAPAFDSALVTHDATDFPLAWAAVFPEASEVDRRSPGEFVSGDWQPRASKNEYANAVGRIRELIAAGDTYQVNYSFPLTSTFSGDAYAWYRELCLAQGGARYCAYLDLERYHVLSLSPELFFAREGDQVTTRPMKGTVRRGRWLEEDEELAHWLQHSAKDKAENIMIVDLLRNDLGKVSLPGSVYVSSLFQPERYETVWQMTSTVEATLRPRTSLVELMGALFPCGSITGAPKIRTMQIIRELEPFPRGIYTGTIGILRPGGDCVFNVAIRTVAIDKESGVATFGVGGGVTIDSTATGEYEECLVKSRFLSEKAVEFELFESMLLEDGKIFLLERHLERLRRSAAFFGFDFKPEALSELLTHIPNKTAKLKLRLRKDGRLTIETLPITNQAGPKLVRLAEKAVNSSNRFLFHKTTNRDYRDDVIFYNERNEVTESGTANVVVQLGDQLFTPPVSCGLLAGTFRDHLLAEGKIKERVITVEELKHADELFLINSVRKWMKAELIVEQDLCTSAPKLL